MSLILSQEYHSTGVNLGYWKVTDININRTSETIQVCLCGYVSKTARESGKTPLVNATRKYKWKWNEGNMTDALLAGGGLLPAIYARIKQSVMSPVLSEGGESHETNPFVNAVDDI